MIGRDVGIGWSGRRSVDMGVQLFLSTERSMLINSLGSFSRVKSAIQLVVMVYVEATKHDNDDSIPDIGRSIYSWIGTARGSN